MRGIASELWDAHWVASLIRQATLRDVPAIEALAHRCLPDADDALQLSELFDAPTEVRRLHVLLVALDDAQQVIGYAFFSPFIDHKRAVVDLTTAELHHIGVDPNHRGTGTARSLEEEGIAELRRIGYRRSVAKVTADGRRLLTSVGWKVLKRGVAHSWLSIPNSSDMRPAGPAARFTYGDSYRPVAVKTVPAAPAARSDHLSNGSVTI